LPCRLPFGNFAVFFGFASGVFAMAITTTPASFVAPIFTSIDSETSLLRGDDYLAFYRAMDRALTLPARCTFYIVQVHTGEYEEGDHAVTDAYWFTDEASALLWANLKEDIQPLTYKGRTRVTKIESVYRDGGYQPGGKPYHREIIKNYW
jgi:hypothetical protein